MKIVTHMKSNTNGATVIVAKMAGKQKTVSYDSSRTIDANHGLAAGAVIQHVQRVSPELQYGDNICGYVVRSLDAGYGTHESNESGTVHHFDV